MRDMMNMVITDNELDNVNGGVAKSVNSYSIQHALARNVQGTPNIATKKSGTKTRRTFRSDQERLGVLAAPREVRSTFLIARLRSAGGFNL